MEELKKQEQQTETCEETQKMTEVEIEDLAIDGICGVY